MTNDRYVDLLEYPISTLVRGIYDDQRVQNRDERLYIIGDIHGCATQLKQLLVDITNDVMDRPLVGKYFRIVFVGDYIDRGPDNFEVLETVSGLMNGSVWELNQINSRIPKPYEGQINFMGCAFLSGNHEVMFLNSLSETYHIDSIDRGLKLSDHSNTGLWLINGGLKLVEEYKTKLQTKQFLIPPNHINFINRLDTHLTFEQCGPERNQTWIIVHAGIRPEQPLDKQLKSDIQWIRNEYYNHDFTESNIRVVGGHTPVKEVVCEGGKYMIDTGCVFGNKLSCIVLETDQPFEQHRILEVANPIDYTKVKY